MLVQYLGFIVVLSGFVWAGRKQIINLLKPTLHRLSSTLSNKKRQN
jgi:hypothetical protein